MTSLISTASQGGGVEREVLSTSPGDPVTGCLAMAQSCIKVSSRWPLGNTCLLRAPSKTGRDFQERWLMRCACWCLRGFWK